MSQDDRADMWGSDAAQGVGSQDTESTTEATADPEAPYGYTLNGEPRKSPAGRPRGAKTGTGPRSTKRPRGASSGPSSGPKPPPRTKARPSSSKGPDYRPAVLGLIQLVGVPLTLAAPLDAAALLVHREALADGVHEAATNDPRVAALLERLLSVGPYGALLAPCLAIGAQIGVNHGVVPLEVGRLLGAVSPADLARACGFTVSTPAPPADERTAAAHAAAAA